jgi:hypothetical protein
MNLPLLHGGGVSAMAAPAGNPLYDVSPDHEAALVAALLMPVLAWSLRQRAARGSARASRLVQGYDRLPAADKLTAWLIAISAVVHLALIGHGPDAARILFLADAVALGWVAMRLVLGLSWRLPAALILIGSIVAWWVAAVGGEPPDQVALATKLVEIAALAFVLAPLRAGRVRGVAAASVTVGLVLVTATVGWMGAFAASSGEGGEGGHHGGGLPAPGTVVTAHSEGEESAAEADAARRLYADTAAAIARYADPGVAAADGYDVEGLAGLGFHAANNGYERDGRILDPERPEQLVYAGTPDGPVLLGAVFQMPKAHLPGPAVGGPLTPWHAHEQICIGLLPPSLTGIVSPLGGCPIASIAVPITPEMIHVWTVPGAPEPFGDLDDAWLRSYLGLPGA